MPITGVSHVSLTVTDLDLARAFWIDVMGFEAKIEQDGLLIVGYPNSAAVIACVTHDDQPETPFDETRVGLDHVALAVDGIAALREWDTRLAEHGVPRSEIVESPFGWHLNVRAPENIAIELLALSEQGRAVLEA